MPLWCTTSCTECANRSDFLSDSRALQLDDGTLQVLRHPGESWDCEKQGLTLRQASQRRRLFSQEYFLCRRCGAETWTITRVPEAGAGLWEPGPWFYVKLCAAVAVVGVPIALWARWWNLAWTLAVLVPLSPLIDLNERRKERRRREAEGKPRLPTDDAPGRVPVPEPHAPGPCCDAPDLVAVARLSDGDRVHCRACGAGVLRVVEEGIA